MKFHAINPCLKVFRHNVIVEVGLKLGGKLCYHAVMLFQFDTDR